MLPQPLNPADGGYQAVLPLGSDGVVDTLNQSAGLDTKSSTNVSVVNSPRTAHSAPSLLFGALENDVNSAAVAEKVVAPFEGANSTEFKPFPVLRPLDRDAKQQIDAVADVQVVLDDIITSISMPSRHSLYALNGTKALTASTAGVTHYSFEVRPSVNFPLRGSVNWTTEVLGSSGVTEAGVTVNADPIDSRQVVVSVPDELVGDVVLYTNYTSTSGTLVFGSSQLVVSRPLLEPITGIFLEPRTISIPEGGYLSPDLFTKYAGGGTKREYIGLDTVVEVTSSDNSVITVLPKGFQMVAKSLGVATITVNYRGFTCQAVLRSQLPRACHLRMLPIQQGNPPAAYY